MNGFYKEVLNCITKDKLEAQFIPTLRTTMFPKYNNELYEPEGTTWVESPIYN